MPKIVNYHRFFQTGNSFSLKRLLGVSGIILLIVLTMGLVPACSYKPSSGIIVAGSTSVQPFAEILAEEYAKTHPGISIDVQGGGSSAGVRAASTGTADIGMSSRDLNGEEKQLWFVEIARDGLALIINPANPISNLTIAQVNQIYAAAVTDWSMLGGAKAKIHVVTREDGSGTRSSFESLIMGKTDITPKAIVQDSNGAVRQVVADDPYAIGYISLGLVDSKVKAVSLNGVAATREDVINGTYNLSRPFLFIAQKAPEGRIKQFVDYVLSPDGKRILELDGLITMDNNAK